MHNFREYTTPGTYVDRFSLIRVVAMYMLIISRNFILFYRYVYVSACRLYRSKWNNSLVIASK